MKVVDAHTVQIITKEPNPILTNQLTNVFIMSKAWSEKHKVTAPQDRAGKEETYAVRHAMGTGPFKLKLREPDVKTVLVKNENWWGLSKYPHEVDEIIYTPIANQATRVAALAAFFPPTDLLDYAGQKIDVRAPNGMSTIVRRLVFREGLDDLTDAQITDQIAQICPALQVRPGTPPVLLIHGDADPVVPQAINEGQQALAEWRFQNMIVGQQAMPAAPSPELAIPASLIVLKISANKLPHIVFVQSTFQKRFNSTGAQGFKFWDIKT